MLEIRNGCDEVLKQNVWGLMYIDELVQTAINQDPHNASSGYGGTENICERFFWVLQDANYNVLGVINPSGRLIERYEYTPYGQRTVYSHGGNIADLTNDGAVDIQDWTQIAADWGTANPASEADINGDGAVDGIDNTAVAANWYWRMVEVRNGCHEVLKQNVWGLGYIDELVHVAINQR